MHHMPSTTDAQLRALAEQDLATAQAIVTGQSVVGLVDVTGPASWWDDLATRARKLLDDVRSAASDVKRGVARKVRDAARRGLSAASEATDDARRSLAAVAAAALATMLGTLLLPALIVFAIVEGSGYGSRARGAARRYVDRRAREYGV